MCINVASGSVLRCYMVRTLILLLILPCMCVYATDLTYLKHSSPPPLPSTRTCTKMNIIVQRVL